MTIDTSFLVGLLIVFAPYALWQLTWYQRHQRLWGRIWEKERMRQLIILNGGKGHLKIFGVDSTVNRFIIPDWGKANLAINPSTGLSDTWQGKEFVDEIVYQRTSETIDGYPRFDMVESH